MSSSLALVVAMWRTCRECKPSPSSSCPSNDNNMIQEGHSIEALTCESWDSGCVLVGEERAGSGGSSGLGVASLGGDGVRVLAWRLEEVSSVNDDRWTSICCFRCSLQKNV